MSHRTDLPVDLLEWPLQALEYFQERWSILEIDGSLDRGEARARAESETRAAWQAAEISVQPRPGRSATDSIMDAALKLLPSRDARQWIANGGIVFFWFSEEMVPYCYAGLIGTDAFHRSYAGRVPEAITRAVAMDGRPRPKTEGAIARPTPAEVIEARRKAKAWTIKKLAKVARVDVQIVYRIKRGEPVSRAAREAVAAALECAPDDLLPVA